MSSTNDLPVLPGLPDVSSIPKKGEAVYLRTSWILNAQVPILVPTLGVAIRCLTQREVVDLAEAARRANPFVRHIVSGTRYLERIHNLVDQTVVQVIRPKFSEHAQAEMIALADLTERTVILCSSLSVKKTTLLRQLAIGPGRRPGFDLTVGPHFRPIRSRVYSSRTSTGILIGRRLCARFENCGFRRLTEVCASGTEIGDRLKACLWWLSESRQDPDLANAIVKTSIALESLLGLSESEPLSRTLAERAAFVLGENPVQRKQLSQAFRRFYDARSALVHGRKPRAGLGFNMDSLEAVDRLVILTTLAVAANSSVWDSGDSIRLWCEDQRWGITAQQASLPFSSRYVEFALRRIQGALAARP